MNTIFYWDVFCLKALEKWKRDLGERIVEWFEVIGEMEALSSLAAVRFAFPNWTDAEIVEGPFLIEGEAIGHPLIGQQQRIDNPISLKGNGAIWRWCLYEEATFISNSRCFDKPRSHQFR